MPFISGGEFNNAKCVFVCGHAYMCEREQRGEKGEQGRVGIAGMPGIPGTPVSIVLNHSS